LTYTIVDAIIISENSVAANKIITVGIH